MLPAQLQHVVFLHALELVVSCLNLLILFKVCILKSLIHFALQLLFLRSQLLYLLLICLLLCRLATVHVLSLLRQIVIVLVCLHRN